MSPSAVSRILVSVARSMFPPLITQTTRLPRSRSRELDGGGQRGGARAFGEAVRGFEREAHAAGELVLGERHDVVQLALQDART